MQRQCEQNLDLSMKMAKTSGYRVLILLLILHFNKYNIIYFVGETHLTPIDISTLFRSRKMKYFYREGL